MGAILHISAKLQSDICKTSCWLTEEFDGGVNWLTLCNFRGLIEVLLILGGNWRNLQFQGSNCLFTQKQIILELIGMYLYPATLSNNDWATPNNFACQKLAYK